MSTVASAPAGLRRDAARNRDKILAAARAAFDEGGVDVGVEAIAHRAGVGVGTLYRRFPTKEALIEAVVNEVLEDVLSAAETALVHEPAADGFTEYLRAVGRLQFEHSGCLTRLWERRAGRRPPADRRGHPRAPVPGPGRRFRPHRPRLRGRHRAVLVAPRGHRGDRHRLSRRLAPPSRPAARLRWPPAAGHSAHPPLSPDQVVQGEGRGGHEGHVELDVHRAPD